MKTDDQQPKNYPPSTEQPQDKVKEEAVAYAKPKSSNDVHCRFTITELEQMLLTCAPEHRGTIGTMLVTEVAHRKPFVQKDGSLSCRFTLSELEQLLVDSERQTGIPADIAADTFKRMHPEVWK